MKKISNVFGQKREVKVISSEIVFDNVILNFPMFTKSLKSTFNAFSLIVLFKLLSFIGIDSTIVLGKRLVISNEKASAPPDKGLQKRLCLPINFAYDD